MTAPVGIDCKLYRNTGTHASPTWNLVDTVEDVSLPERSWEMATMPSRASSFERNAPTIQKLALKFKLWQNADPTDFDAIEAAFEAKTPIEWLVLRGAIGVDGTKGIRCYFVCQSFAESQNLREFNSHDTNWVPAFYKESDVLIEPDLYEVEL